MQQENVWTYNYTTLKWETKTQSFIATINSVFRQFGIAIDCIKKMERIKGTKRRIYKLSYSLVYVNDIDQYAKDKLNYNIVNN